MLCRPPHRPPRPDPPDAGAAAGADAGADAGAGDGAAGDEGAGTVDGVAAGLDATGAAAAGAGVAAAGGAGAGTVAGAMAGLTAATAAAARAGAAAGGGAGTVAGAAAVGLAATPAAAGGATAPGRVNGRVHLPHLTVDPSCCSLTWHRLLQWGHWTRTDKVVSPAKGSRPPLPARPAATRRCGDSPEQPRRHLNRPPPHCKRCWPTPGLKNGSGAVGTGSAGGTGGGCRWLIPARPRRPRAGAARCRRPLPAGGPASPASGPARRCARLAAPTRCSRPAGRRVPAAAGGSWPAGG
jgi:hypothetical protein